MMTATRDDELTTREPFGTPADEASVRRAIEALEANGIPRPSGTGSGRGQAHRAGPGPGGANVHHGASQTLDATGISEELDTSGRYDPVGPRAWSMDRATQGDEIRRLTAAPDVMLGSVHAVTETGSLHRRLDGRQPAWPVRLGRRPGDPGGRHSEDRGGPRGGLRRIYDYALPLEDARALSAYGMHSAVNKVLIINREVVPGRITVVLVDEALGF